jgi:hypothetical protein
VSRREADVLCLVKAPDNCLGGSIHRLERRGVFAKGWTERLARKQFLVIGLWPARIEGGTGAIRVLFPDTRQTERAPFDVPRTLTARAHRRDPPKTPAPTARDTALQALEN